MAARPVTINVVMTQETKLWLRRRARKEGRSISQLCRRVLEDYRARESETKPATDTPTDMQGD